MHRLLMFGDESADERKERVFALSLVIGTETEWEETILRWLSITRGAEFHANEFETEFVADEERVKHPKRLEEYRSLIDVLVDSHLAGFVFALDLGSFRELFPQTPKDSPYSKCFTDILGVVATLTRQWNQEQANGGPNEECLVELTFDRRQGEGTLETLHETFMNQPEWRDEQVFATSVKFDTRQNPRIQVADLLAREGMKELDRQLTRRAPSPRKSFLALSAPVKKFNFVFRQRSYFERWQQQQAALESAVGFTDEGYSRWLSETGRVQDGVLSDNLRNRAVYLAWLDRPR